MRRLVSYWGTTVCRSRIFGDWGCMSSANKDACDERNSQRASLIVQLSETQTVTCDCNASFVHRQVWFVAVHGESAMAVARHSIFTQSASKWWFWIVLGQIIQRNPGGMLDQLLLTEGLHPRRLSPRGKWPEHSTETAYSGAMTLNQV